MKCDAIDTFMGFLFSFFSLSKLFHVTAALTETMEAKEAHGTKKNAPFIETKQRNDYKKKYNAEKLNGSGKNETSL